jgi:hypothetical protein
VIATIFDFEEQEHSVLVLIIEKANLDRMRLGDPITLESRRMGGKVLPTIRFPNNLSLLIAYEEDEIELYRLATKGDARLLMKYLERAHMLHLHHAKKPEAP